MRWWMGLALGFAVLILTGCTCVESEIIEGTEHGQKVTTELHADYDAVLTYLREYETKGKVERIRFQGCVCPSEIIQKKNGVK